MRPTSQVNLDFAADIGDAGLVHTVGGDTQGTIGGAVDPASRAVSAPVGVVEFLAEEMIVRVGAGMTIAALAAELANHGQFVALPPNGPATVGGALAVGRSGIFQLGYGLVRDTLLEAQYVTPAGTLLQAGAPVVKNVSGFDLCRLLVGSLGTLGQLAEVVLRTRPVPPATQWLVGTLPANEIITIVTRPASLMTTTTNTFVCIEGAAADVNRLSQTLQASGMHEASGPPPLPVGRRQVVMGSEHTSLRDGEVALNMTGTTLTAEDEPLTVSAPVARLSQQLRNAFDPDLRFNRGRQPWQAGPDDSANLEPLGTHAANR